MMDASQDDTTQDESITTIEIYMTAGYARHEDVDTESERFRIASDLRAFGTDAFESFDHDPQHAADVAFDRLGNAVELPADEFEDDDAVLGFVYETCQGPTNAASLPYNGADHRSMTVGDVIVVDGTPHMVDRIGFTEINVEIGDGDGDDDGDGDSGDDDSPDPVSDRFPGESVDVEAGDRLWIDSGTVSDYTEIGEGGKQGCTVVDVDGAQLTVEYPRHGNTETATISHEHIHETDLEVGDRVTVAYDSVYTTHDADQTEKTATVTEVRRSRGGAFEGVIVETDEGKRLAIRSTGGVKTRGENARLIGRNGVVTRAREPPAEADENGELVTSGGFVTEPDGTQWCPECQRRRLSCSHLSGKGD